MNPASITRLDLTLAAPEMFVLAAVCVVLLVDLFVDDRRRWITFVLSLVTLAGASWVTSTTGFGERTVGWFGAYVADPLSSLLKLVAYGAVAVAFLYGYGYLQVRRILKGEYFVLGLFALLGIMVLVWCPTVPVPRLIVPALGVLASSSLYIYLTHFQVYKATGIPALNLALSLGLGILTWWLVSRVTAALGHRPSLRRRRTTRALGQPADSTSDRSTSRPTPMKELSS